LLSCIGLFFLSTGCNNSTYLKNFSETGNALAKNINQLKNEPGMTSTAISTNPDKKLMSIGIGYDHSKISKERLKQLSMLILHLPLRIRWKSILKSCCNLIMFKYMNPALTKITLQRLLKKRLVLPKSFGKPNNLVIKVINHGKDVAIFPVKASQSERKIETITLGEQKYTITSITLNSDNYSGHVNGQIS
jgi:hypothetical protein